MSNNTPSFKDSQEAAYRRIVRGAIRKADFTKSERDVTMALVNFWFHHKGTGKPIHPGREKLANRAGVTVKTVSRVLSMLRAANVLEAVSCLNGNHGNATRYRVNIHPLMTLCGCDWIDQFVRGAFQNVPPCKSKNVPPLAGQNVPRIYNYVSASLSQERDDRSGGEHV